MQELVPERQAIGEPTKQLNIRIGVTLFAQIRDAAARANVSIGLWLADAALAKLRKELGP